MLKILLFLTTSSITLSAYANLYQPQQIHYHTGQPPFSPQTQVAVLTGNPNLPGLFSVRIKMPPNFVLHAHWHSTTEHSIVLAGMIYAGFGNKADIHQAKAYPAGSFLEMPTGKPHFGIAGPQGVTVQLYAMGPWSVHYVEKFSPDRKK